MKNDTGTANILAALRILMGFIFLWAFLEQLLPWTEGNSPTLGFLKFGTRGPLAGVFQGMAGHPLVDMLYMLGLLGVGLAFILGIGMKIAAASGSLMMLLIYAASFPPEHNPFVDEHIIYMLVLILLARTSSGNRYGLGRHWKELSLIKKHPILK